VVVVLMPLSLAIDDNEFDTGSGGGGGGSGGPTVRLASIAVGDHWSF